MSVYSYRIICARVCKCVWVCVRVCVCERGIAETNEGHPDDLDSCKWRRLTETYQYWCFFFCFVSFSLIMRVCMKNTSTAWPALSPVDKRWSSMCPYTPPPPPPPPNTPCLPVNGHPSDCQGISQVVVQLTLTYFTCVVLGVHLLSFFGVSCEGYTRTSLEYCRGSYGCRVSHTFPSFFRLWYDHRMAGFHFISWLCYSFSVSLSSEQGKLFWFPRFIPHPVLHICDGEWWCGWNGNRSLRATLRVSLFMWTFLWQP